MTVLLSELLDVKEQSLLAESLNLLFEYLGNLDVIDKSLLRPLQNVKASGYGDNIKWHGKLKKQFGQNSGVEKFEVVGRNSDKTWSTYADNKEYLSLVMSYDGDQVMALTDLSRVGQDRPGKANLLMVLNTKFFDKVMDKDVFNAQFGNKRETWENRAVQLSNSSHEAQSFARKVMDIIVKKARAEGKAVEVMFITKDTERGVKSAERAKQRQGRVPTPNDPEVFTYSNGRSRGVYELYIDGLKSQLRDKLEKYKSSKAKKVESPEEFLKLVIEEGYLDKITVKGVTYKFSNERLYMRDLINASKGKSTEWSNESYIQYEMESSDYYELRAEVQKKYKPELEKLDKEAPDFEKKYEELRDKMYSEIPPRTLKVMLQLKGGSIVPVEVKPEHR